MVFTKFLKVGLLLGGLAGAGAATAGGTANPAELYEKVRTQVSRALTYYDMRSIGFGVIDHYRFHCTLPQQAKLSTWIGERYNAVDRDVRVDRFGKAYTIRAIQDGFVIGSAGPDRTHGNDDDVHYVFEGLREEAIAWGVSGQNCAAVAGPTWVGKKGPGEKWLSGPGAKGPEKEPNAGGWVGAAP